MKHYFRKNDGKQLPWHVLSIDTETQSVSKPGELVQSHKLVLGCLVYRRYYRDVDGVQKSFPKSYRFESIKELVALLKPLVLKPKRRCYMYAHNANFDYGVVNLHEVFRQLGLETELYINQRPPVIVIGKRGTSSLICLDSLNLFPFSLEHLAKAMGFDGKYPMPDIRDKGALYAYCKRDTLLLSKILDRWRTFVLLHDLGNYRYTLASQALSAYRHKYLPEKTLIQTEQEWILRTEREVYYGGRTEAFVIGRVEGLIRLVDVNSMYPYVMGQFTYPTRFRIYRRNTNPVGYPLPDGVEIGMARISCTLTMPVLPVVRDGRLCFPVGKMVGVWTWVEIFNAIPYMKDILWHDFWAYDFRPLFREWSTDMYALRLVYEDSTQKAFGLSVKLLLNSLYGKFGQMTPEWIDIGESNRPEGDEWYHQETSHGPIQRCRVRMGIEQRTDRRTETSHSMPLIAATVTAHARVYMWHLMQEAGLPNVLYMDTDSLMVTPEGYANLEHLVEPRTLGRLGVEWESPWVDIHGAKDYQYAQGMKRKGVKRNAQKIGHNIYRMQQFRSWDYMVGQGKFAQIDIVTVDKHLHRTYHKGVVGSDGIVSPLVLGGDDKDRD